MSYEDKICEAISLMVDKAVSEANFDRTIQAIVQECSDASIGKYKVKYQDSTFYAYATSSDVTYTNGSGGAVNYKIYQLDDEYYGDLYFCIRNLLQYT